MKNENVKKTLAGVSAVVMASSMVAVPASAADVTTITIKKGDSEANFSAFENDGEITLTPTYGADETLAADQSVVWETSDETIATVTNGVVTVKKQGEVTITATVKKEGQSTPVATDDIKITVKDAVNYSVKVNGKTTYTYSVANGVYEDLKTGGTGEAAKNAVLAAVRDAGVQVDFVDYQSTDHSFNDSAYTYVVSDITEDTTDPENPVLKCEVSINVVEEAFKIVGTGTPLTVTISQDALATATASLSATTAAATYNVATTEGAAKDAAKDAVDAAIEAGTIAETISGAALTKTTDYTVSTSAATFADGFTYDSTAASMTATVPVKITLTPTGKKKATFKNEAGEAVDNTTINVTVTLTRENLEVTPAWNTSFPATLVDVEVPINPSDDDKKSALQAKIDAVIANTDVEKLTYGAGSEITDDALLAKLVTVTTNISDPSKIVYTVAPKANVGITFAEESPVTKEIAVTYKEAAKKELNPYFDFGNLVSNGKYVCDYDSTAENTKESLEAAIKKALGGAVTVKESSAENAKVVASDLYTLSYEFTGSDIATGAGTSVKVTLALTEKGETYYTAGSTLYKDITITYNDTHEKTVIVPTISGNSEEPYTVTVLPSDKSEQISAKVAKYVADNDLLVLGGVTGMVKDTDYTYTLAAGAGNTYVATFTLKNTTDYSINKAALATDLTFDSAANTITKTISYKTTTETVEITPVLTLVEEPDEAALNIATPAAGKVTFEYVAADNASLAQLKTDIQTLCASLVEVTGVDNAATVLNAVTAGDVTLDVESTPKTATCKVSVSVKDALKGSYTISENAVAEVEFTVSLVERNAVIVTAKEITINVPRSQVVVEQIKETPEPPFDPVAIDEWAEGDSKFNAVRADVEAAAKDAISIEGLTQGDDYTVELTTVNSVTSCVSYAAIELAYEVTLTNDDYIIERGATGTVEVVVRNEATVEVAPVIAMGGDAYNAATKTLTVRVPAGASTEAKEAAAKAALKEAITATFYAVGEDGIVTVDIAKVDESTGNGYFVTPTVNTTTLNFTANVEIGLGTAAAMDYSAKTNGQDITYTPAEGDAVTKTAATTITGIKIAYSTYTVVTANAAKVDPIEVENGAADADKIAAAEKAALAAISVMNKEVPVTAFEAAVDGKSAIVDGVVTVNVKVTLSDSKFAFAEGAAEATVEVKVTVTEKEAPVVDTTPALTLTTGTDSVKVTWEAVPGADKYAIYGFNSDGLFLGEEVTGTTYTASNLKEGGYGFVVVSCINGEWDYNWTADDIVYTLIKPANTNPVLKVTPGVKSATVSWDAVPGAGMYWLYVFGDNGLVKETLVTGTSTTVTGLEEGKGYAFAAISYFESGWDYNYTAEDLVYTFIQPEDAIPNLMVTPAAGGATVSWEAIPGADLYWLYVFGSNGLVDQMPVDGTSTTVTGLTTGEGYAFVGVSYINGAWNFNWTAEDLVYTIAG